MRFKPLIGIPPAGETYLRDGLQGATDVSLGTAHGAAQNESTAEERHRKPEKWKLRPLSAACSRERKLPTPHL